jgi:isopentenyl-diphosphate delta-isomerase
MQYNEKMKEDVVLVDENNTPLGNVPKAEVHTGSTPLHRAFSCFVVNSEKQLLLQQRSSKKKTWPLVWSNSCCGHPLPGETFEDAVARRLDFELGMKDIKVNVVLPRYKYRYEMQGVVEHEVCPVFVGRSDQAPQPNPDEVENVFWIDWDSFVEEIHERPERYSEWCVEEAKMLAQNDIFGQLISR